MDQTEPVHIHHAPLHPTHHRVLLLLIPSLAFALTLAVLAHNRYLESTPQTQTEAAVVKMETQTVTVGNTEVTTFIARSSTEQNRGLGGREHLGENEGMLFPFGGVTSSARFWMKDMLIPLDFIWIREGKVVQIHEDVPAQGDTPDNQLPLIIPSEPVDHVLEVNAGFVKKYNIQKGDSISL